MKLRHKLTKEDFESLNDNTKSFYEEKDGVYYLQVEGMVPKSRVDEFRENNITLMEDNAALKKENSSIKANVEKFGDLTPEELDNLRKKAEKNSDGKLSDEDFQKAVDDEVSKRTKNMRDEHEKNYVELDDKYKASQGQLSKLVIDNNLSQIAIEHGVADSALPDILLRGSQTYKLEDGKAVPYNKDGEVIYGKDGETPQSMKEWIAELSENAPHLFKESKGTGSKHTQNFNAGGAKDENVRGAGRMRQARGH